MKNGTGSSKDMIKELVYLFFILFFFYNGLFHVERTKQKCHNEKNKLKKK